MPMTEAEWKICTDPRPMLAFLRSNSTQRKLQLFGCGCYRYIWHLLTDEKTRAAVEMAEAVADREGPISIAREQPAPRDADDLFYNPVLEPDPIHELVTERMEEVIQAVALEKHKKYLRDLTQVHPRFETEKEAEKLADLIRDIFGNVFRPVTCDPAWRTANMIARAQSIYDDRAFDRLPILADALEDAGCDNSDILNHCRQPGEHVRGCWVVDLLLGKS
jgi:hypothetical protein